MMKKPILCVMAALLTATVAISVSGCGGEASSTAPSSAATKSEAATNAQTTAAATTTQPTTAQPTTAAPTTAKPTQKPAAATKAPEKQSSQSSVVQKQNNNQNQNQNNNQNNHQNNNQNAQENTPQQNQNSQPKQQEKQEGSFSASDTNFVYNGSAVSLNSDINSALAVLGNANSVDSQMSCHGVGEDKTYYYNGFTVNTYPMGGKDYVMEIVVDSPSVATPKGIRVGSSSDDVVAAYGSGYRQIGYYLAYETGDGKSVQFFVEDGVVQEIDYYYDV